MPVWLSAAICIAATAATAFCFIKGLKQKRGGGRIGGMIFLIIFFSALSLLSAFYLIAAAILLSGIS